MLVGRKLSSRAASYTCGSDRRSSDRCSESLTTPTTSITAPSGTPKRSLRPIGSWPGHADAASDSLTTATRVGSCAESKRPRSSCSLSTEKQSPSIVRGKAGNRRASPSGT